MQVHGTLFDGTSARGRAAALAPADGALVITVAATADAGATVLTWPLREVELAELPTQGAPVRLRCRTSPGAVFVTSGPDSAERLAALLPHLLDAGRRHRSRLGFSAAALAVSAAVVAGVWLGWPLLARMAAHWVPVEWEERLGDGSMAQIRLFGKFCTEARDRPGLKALAALSERLAEGRDLRRPVSVHVMDWSYKNAFALPGGHVVFTSGIIAFMEDPEELAGVLAHEMGHVEKRHVMISLVEQWGLNVMLTVLLGGGGMNDMSHMVLASAYSRALEHEADAVGFEMLTRAGISTGGFAQLFERFRDKEESGTEGEFRLPDFINTHPATESRIEEARQAAKPGAPAMTAQEWAAVKAVCGD